MRKILVSTVILFVLFSTVIASAADFFELCRKGTAEEIRSAILAGADVGSRDAQGNTPLGWATANPNSGVIRVLLDAGADVNAREGPDFNEAKGLTVLHLAAMRLAHKEAKDGWTKMPLESFQELLDAGADINVPSSTGTPLVFAALMPGADPGFIRFLLDRGADANAGDSYGLTPLLAALNPEASLEIVRMLLNAGADVNARDDQGMTTLMRSVFWSTAQRKPERRQVTRLLLRAGAEVEGFANPASNNLPEMNALMMAALGGDPVQVKLLLDAGADAGARNPRGDTAYGIAAQNFMGSCADMILVRGSTILLGMARGLYVLFLLIPFGMAVGWVYVRHVQKRPLQWGILIFLLSFYVGALVLGPGFNAFFPQAAIEQRMGIPFTLPLFFKLFFLLPIMLQAAYLWRWDPWAKNRKSPVAHRIALLVITGLCLALSAAAMGLWSTGEPGNPGKLTRRKKV